MPSGSYVSALSLSWRKGNIDEINDDIGLFEVLSISTEKKTVQIRSNQGHSNLHLDDEIQIQFPISYNYEDNSGDILTIEDSENCFFVRVSEFFEADEQ